MLYILAFPTLPNINCWAFLYHLSKLIDQNSIWINFPVQDAFNPNSGLLELKAMQKLRVKTVKNGQIIELGAVKYKDGQIIDKYESLVYAKDIPKFIQEVTNITPKMLEDAPLIETVLEEFKLFLEDDVFIAHNIKFDYQFVSDSFKKYDLGKLQNRNLCTIDLAKRTIDAKRYGLDFMKELLNIDIDNQHRAYSDALSTSYIFKESLSKLGNEISTVEELINFSKSDNLINKNKN